MNNEQRLRELFSGTVELPERMEARLKECYAAIRRESREAPSGRRRARRGVKTAILVAAAAVLLVGTAVAAAEGNLFQLFSYDERYGAMGENASVTAGAPSQVEEAHGRAEARIDSMYYDGQTLALTFVVTGDRYAEDGYVPSEEELAGMDKSIHGMWDPNWTGLDIPEMWAYREAIDKRTIPGAEVEPYGYVYYTTSVSDHTRTSDGVDLEMENFVDVYAENGEYCQLREYASPLPEELQNLEEITVCIDFSRIAYYHYFDGVYCYTKAEVQEEGTMTATARAVDAVLAE